MLLQSIVNKKRFENSPPFCEYFELSNPLIEDSLNVGVVLERLDNFLCFYEGVNIFTDVKITESPIDPFFHNDDRFLVEAPAFTDNQI